MFYEMPYELELDLSKALAINDKPGTYYSFEPTALGEVVAKWEHFQRCLQEFHEAETTAPAATVAVSAPEIPRPPKSTTDSQLVRDTYLHFPGVFEPFAGLDEQEGIRQWAIHLADLWASPRQHSAPSDYDAAYYNQSGDTRAEFLAALRRIQAAVWLALRAPGAERELFEGRGLIPDGQSKELRGEALMTLATRGAAWLLAWLGWREQHPIRQLFTALGTIELTNANLAITSREAELLPCLSVPDGDPGVEARRFAKLLAEFRQYLPSKRAKLRTLLAELEPLRALPLGIMAAGPASELPARFPMLAWSRLSKYSTNCALAETFWPDLEHALRTRAEWASQAYNIVAGALGKAPEPGIGSPVPSPQPPDTPAEDSCYCRTHPNAETLADLPTHCRIHEVIRGALPEIEKQIAASKLADPAGFRAYCEEELARHAQRVREMAKNLAHPTLYSEAERPQMLELKLWNLTLCSLYRSELAALDADNPAQHRFTLPQPEQIPVGSHPWAEIEALAERIALRKNGEFIPAPKWVAAAVAGMIDALCEAELLPSSGELKRIYADFSRHYGRKVGADRVNSTRLIWKKKARKELRLE